MVIVLQAKGDHAHQITFSFREPEGSGKAVKDKASFVLMGYRQEHPYRKYAMNVVNSIYQFSLKAHGIAAHSTDTRSGY
jgi:hypothetical protein